MAAAPVAAALGQDRHDVVGEVQRAPGLGRKDGQAQAAQRRREDSGKDHGGVNLRTMPAGPVADDQLFAMKPNHQDDSLTMG
jgi:hypothetical protein